MAPLLIYKGVCYGGATAHQNFQSQWLLMAKIFHPYLNGVCLLFARRSRIVDKQWLAGETYKSISDLAQIFRRNIHDSKLCKETRQCAKS
ncbi:MAG: hypothetical protein ACI88A_004331 [Paraglaciecola sp.]|jgi:hypothetical protein